MRRAVVQFAVSGLVAVVVLGFAAVEVGRRTGEEEAIRGAQATTLLIARIVQPAVTDDLLERDNEAAVAKVHGVVWPLVSERDPVVRVKIWSADGTIVYSDEQRLIGAPYPDHEEIGELSPGEVAAEISDLTGPENSFERPYGKLLEVYTPIATPSGKRLLFESYLRHESVAASGRDLWEAFAPAILGGLLLLALVQLPLAWRLARRLDEGVRDRERLLRRALDASDVERRRIARYLHDGVVQSLAGVSYSLAAAAERVPADAADTLRAAAAETRQAIRELRTLLVEIYPPDLHRSGLRAALADLVTPLSARGVEASVEVAADALPPEVEALFFRTAQEALRNVAAHADAEHVDVRVARENGTARLLVADDGRGFDPSARPDGHFGLQLLTDALREVGGTLDVESKPGAGTCVVAEVPLR